MHYFLQKEILQNYRRPYEKASSFIHPPKEWLSFIYNNPWVTNQHPPNLHQIEQLFIVRILGTELLHPQILGR